MIPFSYSASGAQGPARRVDAPATEQGQPAPSEQMNPRPWQGYSPPSFNGYAQAEWSHLNQPNAPFLHYYSNAVAQNPSALIGINNNVPRYNHHSINDHLQMQQSYIMPPQFQYPLNPQHSAQDRTFLQGPAAPAPTTSNLSESTSRKRSASGGDHGLHEHAAARKHHKKNWVPVDDVLPSADKNQEERLMKAYYGSTNLRMYDSSKAGAKLQYKKFVCKVEGCPFECRIRRNNDTEMWLTETTGDEHNHATGTEGLSTVDAAKEYWGLPDEFKVKIIEARKELLSLSVDPTSLKLTRILQGKFSDHVLCHRDNHNKLLGKVMSYVATLDANDRGVMMNNLGDFGRYKNANKLNIPDTLEPTTSYKSPEEIAVALGFEKDEVDKQLVLIPPDDLLQEFQDLYGDEENSMSSSLFVVTPASLFTLLELLTKVPEGFRLVYVDGSRNFILENGAALLPIGTHDVSYREHTYNMSQSLHPFGYALAPGERTKVLACFLRLLTICSRKLFGVDFAPDFGGMDHSTAFANGFTREFGNSIKLLLCFFHAMQIIEDKKQDRPWGVIVGTSEEKNTFHSSIISAFQTIHLCKTTVQFTAGFELVIQFCRNKGQDAYAARLLKTFGPYPWNSFFYANGRHGATPTGSPAENYNRRAKKELKLNVSRAEFLTRQLPKLLKLDAQERVGAQLKQFDGVSKHDESIAILMTDKDVYKHTANAPESKEHYFVNSPSKVGKAITAARVTRYSRALQGNAQFFKDQENDCPLDILKRMVGASQTFCVVTYDEALGVYVGNCKSCYMYLSCPCVTKVRDLKGLLQPSLAETTTPFARRSQGRPQRKRLGGRGGKKKKQEPKEPATVQTYYSRLTVSQLENVADSMKIKLTERPKGQTDVQRRQQLISTILGMVEDNGKK
jgi:hypothetical protein